MAARTWTLAAASVALLAACGGQSRREGQKSSTTGPLAPAPADAVLRVTSTSGLTELRIVRRGQEGTEPFGYADGTYLLSPDRRRMFQWRKDGAVIASVDGTEQALEPNSEYWAGSFSPDGARLALLQDGAPIIADASGVHTVPVANTTEYAFGGIAWAPDGSRVAYGIGSDIVIAKADASEPVVAATGPSVPVSDDQWALKPVWSPRSDQVAVVSNRQGLFFIAADGSRSNRISTLDLTAPDFGWSSDGSWLAVRTVDVGCFAASPIGDQQAVATHCEAAAWSPVDDRLLFGFDTVGTWSPGDDTALTFGSAQSYALEWSPDGSLIAYSPADSRGIVFVDSRDQREVARIPALFFLWNPNATRLTLLLDDGSLVLADARAQNQRTIALGVESFDWLPDGEYLAVITASEAFTIRADGAERTQVFSRTAETAGFSWVRP